MTDSNTGDDSPYSRQSPSFYPARGGIRGLLNLGISALHDDRTDYGIEDLTGRVDRGRYCIGSGSYGDVYQGVWCGEGDKTNLPPIAVKVFRVCGSVDTRTQKKRYRLLRREYEVWKGLRHKNILPFVGIATVDETLPAIISIFMENGSVRAFLQENPDVASIPFLLDIAEGINYLHHFTSVIIHGDLKGDNVLVNEFGIAVICDFGFSRMLLEDTTLWATSAVSAPGTFRWKAPELMDPFSSENTVSKESDIYAYAITSWEIWSRNLPFPDLNDGAVLFAVVQEDARPEMPKNLSQDDPLWLLWQNCWHRDPQERFSASKIVEYMSEIPETTRRSVGAPVVERHAQPGISSSVIALAGSEHPATYSATSDNYSSYAGETLFSACDGTTAPTALDTVLQNTQTDAMIIKKPTETRHLGLLSEDVEYSLDGEIVSGSFRGLFQCFLTGSDCYRKNPAFYTAFMGCLPAFASLLQVSEAFQEALNSILHTEAISVEDFERVLQTMCHWLSSQRPANCNRGVLSSLRQFAHSAGHNLLSKHIKSSTALLNTVIDYKECGMEAVQTYNAAHSSKLYRYDDPTVKDPAELAIALTIIARDRYNNMFPTDFVYWLGGSTSATGHDVIDSHMGIVTDITRWTVQEVLRSPCKDERTSSLELFIRVAKECLHLQNYVAAASILKACTCSKITDLKWTYGNLRHSAKRDLWQMWQAIDTRSEYRAKILCHAADLRNPMKYRDHDVIPNLLTHLEEMQSVWDQHQPFVEVSGVRHINFARYGALSASCSEYLQFQRHGLFSQFDSRREAGVLGYVESQLDLLDSDSDVDARAALLKREETEYRRSLASLIRSRRKGGSTRGFDNCRARSLGEQGVRESLCSSLPLSPDFSNTGRDYRVSSYAIPSEVSSNYSSGSDGRHTVSLYAVPFETASLYPSSGRAISYML